MQRRAYGQFLDGRVGGEVAVQIDTSAIFGAAAVLVSAIGLAAKLIADKIDAARALLEQRVTGLEQRWLDANHARNEQIAELREDTATSIARLDMHATRIAVVETKLGLSPRRIEKPGE